MSKTLLVLRYEVIRTLARKSFLFTVFGIPLLWVLILLGFLLFKGGKPNVPGETNNSRQKASELQVEGYVDHSGLIKTVHEDVPKGILVAYADETSVRQAFRTGQIKAYYIIPADFVETGDLIYINPNYTWASSMGQSWVMRRTLTANLLDNNPERMQRFRHPMDVEMKPLAPGTQQRDEKEKVPFAIPYATAMVTVLVVLMSSGLLLHSIAGEKKNRVMEVLMVSVAPGQMLNGKIIGLGMLGLLQAVVWIGTGYVLLRVGGRPLNLPLSFGLRASMLVWGIVFFLLGYAIYASLMAGLGAVVQNVKEASQATIVVIWPMVLTMMLIGALIEHPHGTLATALSLFPLTAPVAMMTRLAAGGVPSWQPVLAVVLLLFAALFIVRAVARMFRVQLLLSGQPFSAKRFARALLRGV